MSPAPENTDEFETLLKNLFKLCMKLLETDPRPHQDYPDLRDDIETYFCDNVKCIMDEHGIDPGDVRLCTAPWAVFYKNCMICSVGLDGCYIVGMC